MEPEDYEAVRDDLAARLAAIPDDAGRPLATRVYKPEQLYDEVNGVPPDLITIFGDLLWRSVATIGGGEGVHTLENDTGPDDANHAQDGILIAAGAGVSARGRLDASLLDVAPTVLDLLGIEAPGGMRGHSLAGELRRVNLVVYLADALRTDHLGCYGARYVATPTIDELAAGAVRFDQAISAAPWTAPSTASLVTGLYPHHHGYLHWDARLDPALPTLFTVAAAFGYETGSFVFDRNYLFRDFADANVAGTSERLDGAVEWLRANRERPFCLWFHSWATHMPYDILHSERKVWLAAKEEIIAGIQSDSASALEALRESYRQAVERESETLFASFLQALDDLGLRERTALVFLADHGESWGERLVDKHAVKGTYHMHGAALYDEIVQVPLILAAPGLEPAEIRSQVSLVDVMPTLLELAGAPLEGLDGRSLLPVVAGEERDDRLALIAGTDKGVISQLAVRMPPWKLVAHTGTGEEEAYRLDLDPREREPRADPPAGLRRRLHDELASVPRESLGAEEEALVEKRLADLGYL